MALKLLVLHYTSTTTELLTPKYFDFQANNILYTIINIILQTKIMICDFIWYSQDAIMTMIMTTTTTIIFIILIIGTHLGKGNLSFGPKRKAATLK